MEKNLQDFLIEIQNPDGGWGYFPRKGSAYEPTAFAVMALVRELGAEGSVSRALRFIRAGQTAQGGWPVNTSGSEPVAWVTSIVAVAVREAVGSDPVLQPAVDFVISCFANPPIPWMLRVREWLGQPNPDGLDSRLRGWGWTSGTANWVEPTCYALMMLNREREVSSGSSLGTVIAESESMLYNRLCKTSGWNYGNSRVLGEDLRPYPITTSLALLALQRNSGRAENKRSLQYLVGAVRTEHSALGLSYSALCLDAYGQEWRSLLPELGRLHQETRFFGNSLASAITLLALKAVKGNNPLKLNAETQAVRTG